MASAGGDRKAYSHSGSLSRRLSRGETSHAEQIQAALESWVVERAPAEKITGVAFQALN
jgi:hypothetical protein